jgi:hypothetical protein
VFLNVLCIVKKINMPTLSMFDAPKEHYLPHIHVEYQGEKLLSILKPEQ